MTNSDICDSVADDEVDEDTTSLCSVPVVQLKSDCLGAEGVDFLGGIYVNFVDSILTALPVSFLYLFFFGNYEFGNLMMVVLLLNDL